MIDAIQETTLKGRKGFPVLSSNKYVRYLVFVVLYFAQGVPEGMTFLGIPAWLAMQGKTPMEIGSYLGIVSLPWSFKILIAPLMDRFTFLSMGRRRPWVLIGQSGLILSFINLSQVPDPLHHLTALTWAAFAVSFFGALQDVGTDGMAIDVIPHAEQAGANGLMWGAKIIGSSTSLVTGNWIINHYGFESAILTLSSIICVIIIFPLVFREREGEKILPWTHGEASHHASNLQLDSWKTILHSLWRVSKLQTSFVFAIALYLIHIGIGLFDAILPVFTIQGAGWTDTEYSRVLSPCNIVAGLLGMIAGGFMADHFNKKRMMMIYLAGIITIMLGMSMLKPYWHSAALITGFIVTYNLLYVFLTIAIFATGMELCWKRVAASQFTLYMTIANLGRASGGSLLGPLRNLLDWQYLFSVIAFFALLMFLLIRQMHMHRHHDRVEVMEEDFKSHGIRVGELETDLPR